MEILNGSPRRRRWAAAVLTCAVVLVPAGALAGFRSGTYTGTTSQPDNFLQLGVNSKKTKATVVFFEFDAPPCADPQFAGLRTKIRDDGTFRAKGPVDGLYGYVKGRFHGRMADGKARYYPPGTGCDSGVVTWQAAKG